MNYANEAMKAHKEWKGKIEIVSRVEVDSREKLSVAYTPGVAAPCLAIHDDVDKSFELTRRWNTVPVITDGTAVLGLGDIGPEAGMPVMEGKCALYKAFGDVDAYPLCLQTKDTEEIIRTIKLLAGSFGGVNLEDISAPRCFEIESRLKKELNIPVFHDDQHGTAIITAAALLNALKLTGKSIGDIHVVVNGAGAAGIAIAKFVMSFGVKDVIAVDRLGILAEGDTRFNVPQQELARITNRNKLTGTLADAMKGADVFIGVSVANCVTKDMVRSMAEKPILFTCANPVPEIMPDAAKAAGARVVGTGRSDFPNQVNNVVAFPGIFKGALEGRAVQITEEMKLAAARAIAGLVPDDKLNEENIMPEAFDPRVAEAVAEAVKSHIRQ